MGLGLLLLLLPWGALGNVGGSAGACACTHRWPQEPPPGVRLPPLAPRVLRAERCPRHVVSGSETPGWTHRQTPGRTHRWTHGQTHGQTY
ncbi:C-X-C motif chemokine 16 isoform X3 [Nyctibius grandis]|uniref:C-X-C motif chemokine 16 isoform X3 n=1 Tax=Nyctibius grandis TaxID=48427 RepID=UPI0035BBB2B7